MGLCSYLLIGFWYQRPSAAEAGKKAFIVNRVGDFGFGLGVMLLWTTLGTLQYAQTFDAAATRLTAGGGLITAILGGHVDWMTLSLPATMPFEKSGDVKIVLLTRRSPELPGVPSGADAGMTDVSVNLWMGLFAHPKTPKPAYDRLVSAVAAAIKDPEVSKKLSESGFLVSYKGPSEFSKPNGTNGPLSTVSGSLAAEVDLPSTSNDETEEQPQADERIPAGNAATPIPWEERRGFLDLGAYWQTTQGILFHPARSFAQWNPPGDMEGALLFLVVFGSVGHILAHYWLMFLQNDMGAAVGMPGDWLGFGLFALKAPFLVLLSSLVSAAIIHFFMFLLRATSHAWSKTFAFYAYLGGALACLQLLPVLS